MRAVVNGETVELAADAVVADVVAQLGHDPQQPGVAAAVDGTVVRRADWATTVVTDGAVIEVLTAVQGGA